MTLVKDLGLKILLLTLCLSALASWTRLMAHLCSLKAEALCDSLGAIGSLRVSLLDGKSSTHRVVQGDLDICTNLGVRLALPLIVQVSVLTSPITLTVEAHC